MEKLEFLLSSDFEHLRKDPEFPSKLLVSAVDSADVNVVKLVCSSPTIKDRIDFQYNHGLAFLNACEHGNAEIVKYFATSPELKDKVDIHTSSDNGFRMACKSGHLEVVKNLIEIVGFGESWSLNNCLSVASQANQPEVVKYLLKAPEYKHYVDDSAHQSIFNDACYHGNIDFAKYLLSSPELEKHADVNGDTGVTNDYSFSNGIIAAIKGKQSETLRFLIFDMNAEKTETIEKYLSRYPDEETEKFFTIRQTHENLVNKLPTSEPDAIKVRKNKL